MSESETAWVNPKRVNPDCVSSLDRRSQAVYKQASDYQNNYPQDIYTS